MEKITKFLNSIIDYIILHSLIVYIVYFTNISTVNRTIKILILLFSLLLIFLFNISQNNVEP